MKKSIDEILIECQINQDLLTSRDLCRYQDAIELETVQIDNNGKEHYLIPEAAQAWREMKDSALKNGIELIIISAFRSIDYQAGIIKRKLDRGLDINEILKVSAAPGYSEHHTGRAIDIATPNGPVLEEDFELTTAFKWLQENANKFKFYLSFGRNNSQGYIYEPWHWCYQK